MTPQLLFKEAVSLHQQGRLAQAENLYRQIMVAAPENFAVRYMFGLMRFQQTRNAEALETIETALKLNPGSADALALHGILLHRQGRREEALASLDAAVAAKPDDWNFWYNRGLVLLTLGRFADALAAQDRSVALNPNHAEAWYWRGMALSGVRRYGDARESFGKALAIKPDHAEALYRRGIAAWMGAMDYDAALRDLERAVRLDPGCPYAPGWLLLIRQYGGDWRDFTADVARIDEGVRAGKKMAEPFLYQAISQSPADLQACSAIFANDRYPAREALAPRRTRGSGKIRIGYISGEFRDQATAYLTAGLYECHDREKFEIVAFDNGWNDHSPVRRRLDAALGKIMDISRLSGRQAAETILAEDIDILVNLNGYFGDHRMDVFAHRPAPVQVNYLGFPATLGARYIDYLIADRIVIPEGDRKFYAEQIVYLPDSYQVNDSRRGTAEAPTSRTECGLPEKKFVFCNFNASYKLTPQAFTGWMRILHQVPESVLWLLEFHPRFAENLRRRAEQEGVAGTRIVFAPVVTHEVHQARLKLADLFLDALPYNAHTTASDALWAGVPLVTCRGTAFAGRVAASLLATIGLPELVTENTRDFEALAVKLAREPALLKSLREKLARNRHTAPLFDTGRFTRNIETAYRIMMDKQARGQGPESFAVG